MGFVHIAPGNPALNVQMTSPYVRAPVGGGFVPSDWLTYNDADVTASIGESVDSTITDWVDTLYGAATYQNLANAPILREYNGVKYVEFDGNDQMELSGADLTINDVTIVGLARATSDNLGHIMGRKTVNVQITVGRDDGGRIVGSPTLWGNALVATSGAPTNTWTVFTASFVSSGTSSLTIGEETPITTTNAQAADVKVNMLGAINGQSGHVDIQGFVSKPTALMTSDQLSFAQSYFKTKCDLLNA